MKSVLLLILMFAQICSAQTEQHFAFSSAKLDKVLADIEQKFDVKYSYADSIVSPKSITLTADKYTLEQLNIEISRQTSLTIVKIDQRYYSLYSKPEDSQKNELLKEILVEGFLSKGINKVGQKIIISPQKVEELPGVTDADILFSLQQLPGVKSPNETASGLHIRGGTPDQNLILWDGIRMYHPGHLFGMISGFNPNVEQTVHYYNKAASPKFGERISSIIDIKSSDKIQEDIKVNAGINAVNADLYLRVPLLKNKLGLQLSGRKSFTEWLQSPTFNSLAEKVFQNTNFHDFDASNRFQFQDYSAKLNYEPNKNTSFSFTGIAIDNYLNFSVKENLAERNQKMDIINHGYSFNWTQNYNEKLKHKVLIYYSAYTFDYEKHRKTAVNEFETFTKMNRITDSGAEMNFNYKANGKLDFEFGYQLFGNDISHSFTSKTQDLEIDLDQRHLYSISHVAYSNAKYNWGKWDFKAGARFNFYTSLNAQSFEPRAFIQRKLTDAITWQISYERKSQIMSQVRESVANDLSLENYVWILSDDGEYPIHKANQFTSGLIYKSGSWLVDVDGYYKTITGITSLSFGFLQQFDSSAHHGEGFTKGLDILVQKSTPTWRAWMTYTYQDSRNKYEGINIGDYFPINADIRHSFTASFYKKWKNYSAALGWFWRSGKPYSTSNESGQIESLNDERLAGHHRLDVSVTYQFKESKSWTGKIGFSVLNLYNQQTIISREYEKDYITVGDFVNSSFNVRDYYSLGITPNIFFRVNF